MSGVAWSTIQGVGGKTIGLVFLVVLVRLLTPEAFGLMAAAAVFLAVADLLMEQGLGKAIVQRRDLRPEHADTAFCVQMGLAVSVCAGGMAAAPWLAGLYQRPDLVWAIRLILLAVPLVALRSVQEALLERNLEFKTLAKRQLGATFAGGLAAVAMASAGYGVASLLAQVLVAQTAAVALLWSSSHWRPRVRFDRGALRDLVGFSGYLFAARGLGVLKTRADHFLIAFYLGPVALGLYAMAFRLVDGVTRLLLGNVGRLNLSVFARLQSSPNALRDAYRMSVLAAAAFGFPAAAGLFLMGPDLVRLVLGPQWTESAPVLQVLAVTIVSRSVTMASATVMLAMGRPFLRLLVNAGSLVVSLLVVWMVVERGIVAVAAVNAIAGLLLLLVHAWVVSRVIRFDVLSYSRVLLPPLGAALLMLVVLWPVKAWMEGAMPIPAALAASTGIGVLVYGTALWRTSTDSRHLAGRTLDWMVARIGFHTAPVGGVGSGSP